ncbi:hypothetical protein [Deinococcus sp. AJ005]|uniref:hypothetical protein n=1 Tax=Deinococcus sp. AJ005 TaxID=2652443 RepID=UPI00125CA99D|nr:hypothetical protein [Deinococcus sp. AJ005]QFP77457.1 hypothetical protein DAAJ005_14040 [Deinococcus sp. AJ005]
MNSRSPRTKTIYNEVLNALYSSDDPMSIEDIKTVVEDDASGITNLTSKLLNQSDGYSPIRRVGYNSYTLTSWARELMNAGDLPSDPRYMSAGLFMKEPTAEEGHMIVDFMTKALLENTSSLQNQAVIEEVLQHVVADNYDVIKDVPPRSLIPFLNEAIIEADSKSRGAIFSWIGSGSFTISNGHQAKSESIWFSSKLPSLSSYERLNLLLKVVPNLDSYRIFPRSSEQLSQAIFKHSNDVVRVYISDSGETIKGHQIRSLLREVEPGEKLRIYAMGQVLPQALELAASEGVEIVLSDQTKRMLSNGLVFGGPY